MTTTPAPEDHALDPERQTLLEYQAILENAWVGILFTRNQRVLHCNPRFSEIFGWPHGELVGQHGSCFISALLTMQIWAARPLPC